MTARYISDFASLIDDVPVESVARYFGGSGYTADGKTRERILGSIEVARKLISPAVTYSLYPVVDMVSGKTAIFEDGSELSFPGCCEVGSARFVAAVIGTLGSGLENKCRNLAANGEVYMSTLLDAVGTVMLDGLSEKVCEILEKECGVTGALGGLRFGPGIDGYPLDKQHQLFQMADSDSVGVTLNSSAIMEPVKSVSFFLVVTESGQVKEKTHKCDVCRLRDCQFRLDHTTI